MLVPSAVFVGFRFLGSLVHRFVCLSVRWYADSSVRTRFGVQRAGREMPCRPGRMMSVTAHGGAERASVRSRAGRRIRFGRIKGKGEVSLRRVQSQQKVGRRMSP